MHWFNLSIPLALFATVALSAQIGDSPTTIAKALEKRTDVLIDDLNNHIYPNPTAADLTAKKVVLGCFIPSKGFTIYYNRAPADCGVVKGVKVYPLDAAST